MQWIFNDNFHRSIEFSLIHLVPFLSVINRSAVNIIILCYLKFESRLRIKVIVLHCIALLAPIEFMEMLTCGYACSLYSSSP